MAELALDDHERDAFVGEFPRVRMAHLLRGKALADTGDRRRVVQLREAALARRRLRLPLVDVTPVTGAELRMPARSRR